MAGSGGFALSRAHGGDRFYNPPPIRRHQQQQQLLLQQQQQQQQQQQRQLHRPLKSDSASEAGSRTDSEESALLKPSACSPSPPPPPPPPPPPAACSTNLDRLMESVTPFVSVQYCAEASSRGWRNPDAEAQSFYSLGDLWDCFKEWSVYGAGVPLLLNGKDSVKQYYVPFLSGIQLYVDPLKRSLRPRRPGEESDPESSRETSSNGSSDCEVDRRAKYLADGAWSQQNPMTSNSQKLNKLSLRDKSIKGSSSDEAEVCNSTGLLVFEYLEQEQPHHRKPLVDKISVLASQFPELRMYRSCDLLPSSWFSVAWYPIYRIPVGPTLQNLDASFLTFHSLSTNSKSRGRPQLHASNGTKLCGNEACSKISLPVFGLASYKLKGSILTPSGPLECQQENSLLQAADSWLGRLQVDLPDYRFFLSHNSQIR